MTPDVSVSNGIPAAFTYGRTTRFAQTILPLDGEDYWNTIRDTNITQKSAKTTPSWLGAIK